jgi:hypothetical protein
MTRLWRLAAPIVLIAGSFLAAAPAQASGPSAGYTCSFVTLLPGGSETGDFGLGSGCVAAPGMPTSGAIGFGFTMANATTGYTIQCETGSVQSIVNPLWVNGQRCVQVR